MVVLAVVPLAVAGMVQEEVPRRMEGRMASGVVEAMMRSSAVYEEARQLLVNEGAWGVGFDIERLDLFNLDTG